LILQCAVCSIGNTDLEFLTEHQQTPSPSVWPSAIPIHSKFRAARAQRLAIAGTWVSSGKAPEQRQFYHSLLAETLVKMVLG